MILHTSVTIVASAFVLLGLGHATAQAPLVQHITFTAGSDLQLPHVGAGQHSCPTIAAGTALGSAPLIDTLLDNNSGGLHSSLSVWSAVSNRELTVTLYASMSEVSNTDATASLPEQSVLLHIDVPHAMKLSFDIGVAILIGQDMPSATGSIDVGDDGAIDLTFTSPEGVCSGDHRSIVRDVPAGTLPVRLSFAGQLPIARDASTCRAVNVTTGLTIRPAHAEVRNEGGGCQTPLWVEPVLDGRSVELGVYGQVSGSLAWLLVGADTTHVPLPLSNCSLLVQPDLLLVGTPWLHQTLPLGLYGPGHLYVQGAIWQPATWIGGQAQLLSTHRHRIDLR